VRTGCIGAFGGICMQAKDETIRLGAGSMPGSARANILVVEPNMREAERIAVEMRHDGFEVEIETDLAKARERLMFERFRAILCSIEGGKGLDLLTLARAYDKDMPFMLLVDEQSLEGLVEAIRLGSTQYALKPIVVSRVVDTLKECFSRGEFARTAKKPALKPVDNLTPALEQAYMALQQIVLTGVDGAREIHAYEALLRSDYASLSSPLDILNAAEVLGRVQDVGRRVRDLSAEIALELPVGTLLFVNVHARELNDDMLYDRSTAFSRAANRIVLEITEREEVKNVKGLEQRLLELRIMGFRIAVDDLGAGYAGLASFATLEPDYVKLDMSLVRGVHLSALRQRVVRSVLTLSRELGIKVIAEGVENEQEFACLHELGVRYFQGYLVGKPNARRKA
jgi:EAL domain-containing protein (putative c-di-GMP-specific phosphodiesterase class I)